MPVDGPARGAVGRVERRQVDQIGIGTPFCLSYAGLIAPPVSLLQTPQNQSNLLAYPQGYVSHVPVAPTQFGYYPPSQSRSTLEEGQSLIVGQRQVFPEEKTQVQSKETPDPSRCCPKGLDILAQAATNRQKVTSNNSGDSASTKPDSYDGSG